LIGVSRLLVGTESYGDSLRYAPASRGQTRGTVAGRGPVVVWNITRSCNLRCVHCYSDSEPLKYEGELRTEEALRVVDDLAAFRVPVILWSGGEPLIRRDLLDLVSHAREKGIRSTISTNGTLIDRDMAERIKAAGVSYVGVSLDGIGEVNDAFRGRRGAFRDALAGIRNLMDVGQKVGLRFTMTRHNIQTLPEIFALIEAEGIQRVCFYHLVYSGRGRGVMGEDLDAAETRRAVDYIFEKALEYGRQGSPREVLTVDNHADGIYLYLRSRELAPRRSAEIYELLARNGGNRSGIAIADIDFLGNVHPDQFSWNVTLGNVREEPFSVIWSRDDHPILEALRNRREKIGGRCRTCNWFHFCNGNFRARAYGATGDFWAADPGCYLTDEEIQATDLLPAGAAAGRGEGA